MMQRYWDKKRGEEEGFTLVELLVVIAILAILAAIVVVSIGAFGDKGKSVSCSADTSALTNAEEAYNASTAAGNGSYGSMTDLVSKKFITSASTLHSITLTNGTYTLSGLNGCT